MTKNGEWFEYRIKAVGSHIQFWINDKPVMTYDDSEYKEGHFAIQGHNPGMKIEAKDLYYRILKGSMTGFTQNLYTGEVIFVSVDISSATLFWMC